MAVQWYELAVIQGHAEAQYRLGLIYCRGYKVHRDYVKALDLLVQSAEQGFAKAQFKLTVIYEQGLCGQAQDLKHARKYCFKAAKQRHLAASVKLGDILRIKTAQKLWPIIDERPIVALLRQHISW